MIALTENPPVQIYPNKIKNRIVSKIKTGRKLELLTPEAIRLLGSTKEDVDADKNSENVPKLESVEIVLVRCNLLNNDYQHLSKVLFNFIPNKQLIKKVNKYFTKYFNNDEYSGLQIKLVKHLKLKIMSICH